MLEHRPALPRFAGGSDRQPTFPAVMSSLHLGDNEPLAVTQQQAHVLLNHRDLVGLLALAVLFCGMSVFYRWVKHLNRLSSGLGNSKIFPSLCPSCPMNNYQNFRMRSLVIFVAKDPNVTNNGLTLSI